MRQGLTDLFRGVPTRIGHEDDLVGAAEGTERVDVVADQVPDVVGLVLDGQDDRDLALAHPAPSARSTVSTSASLASPWVRWR